MWTHNEVDLAPYPVVGLVLIGGDTEKFTHALGFESLDPFFFLSESTSKGPCFTAVEEDGGDRWLTSQKQSLFQDFPTNKVS